MDRHTTRSTLSCRLVALPHFVSIHHMKFRNESQQLLTTIITRFNFKLVASSFNVQGSGQPNTEQKTRCWGAPGRTLWALAASGSTAQRSTSAAIYWRKTTIRMSGSSTGSDLARPSSVKLRRLTVSFSLLSRPIAVCTLQWKEPKISPSSMTMFKSN